MRRVIRAPALATDYKVLFADIHSLRAAALPEFDLVSLFHLCEFGDPASAARVHDAAGVLQTFISRMAPGGRLLLYRGSFGYRAALALVDARVAAGDLAHVEDYASLSIYRVAQAPAPRA